MAINACPLCLDKQREIDDLKEENRSLRAALRREQRKMEDGAFGSSTPSSKIPIKPNTEEREKKPKGARLGHPGNGRKSHEAESADRIVDVQSDIDVS
jgi:transposase